MYCDQCGASLVAGQLRCVRCGKEIRGYYQPSRVQEHVRLLGILWLALSALSVIGGAALVAVANTVFGTWGGFRGPAVNPSTMWLRPFLTFIGCLILAKAAAGFIAGWGLLQRESWGRLLALVMGFISLFNVPLGTALGIYTFWVLLPGEAEQEYRALSQAA
jgi:hypothetical protein